MFGLWLYHPFILCTYLWPSACGVLTPTQTNHIEDRLSELLLSGGLLAYVWQNVLDYWANSIPTSPAWYAGM